MTSNVIKFKKDPAYIYVWSVDGNRYGDPYDTTTYKGFADEQLEKNGWELCLKVNGSLFYTYDGKHFACGLEKSKGVNNQDIGMSAVYDYNDCMAIAGVGGELYFASQKWIINNVLTEAYCAVTGLGLLLGGKKRDDLHKGFEAQWAQRSGRTVIGEDRDSNFMSYSFAGETGKSGMTCAELQNKCLDLGFYNCIALDGGGSVFRQYRNDQNKLVYDITTTRKVKNALMLYRKRQPADSTDDRIKALEEENANLKEAIGKKDEQLRAIKDVLEGE